MSATVAFLKQRSIAAVIKIQLLCATAWPHRLHEEGTTAEIIARYEEVHGNVQQEPALYISAWHSEVNTVGGRKTPRK